MSPAAPKPAGKGPATATPADGPATDGPSTTERSTTEPVPGAPTGPDPDELGYERARDELVEIVRRLESGSGTLEESLQLWERGEALAVRCEQWLAGARERMDALLRARSPEDPGQD